jgi:hypothetical protein
VSHSHSGRHEHGQNFLHDRGVIDAIVLTVDRTGGPIVEIGAGDGALTRALQKLDRPLTAIEIDPYRAVRLAKRTKPCIRVVEADFLKYPLPRAPHIIVGNLPFSPDDGDAAADSAQPGLDRCGALGAVGGRPPPSGDRRRHHDDRAMVAVVRIRFGAKGFRVVVSAATQRRRWADEDRSPG